MIPNSWLKLAQRVFCPNRRGSPAHKHRRSAYGVSLAKIMCLLPYRQYTIACYNVICIPETMNPTTTTFPRRRSFSFPLLVDTRINVCLFRCTLAELVMNSAWWSMVVHMGAARGAVQQYSRCSYLLELHLRRIEWYTSSNIQCVPYVPWRVMMFWHDVIYGRIIYVYPLAYLGFLYRVNWNS